jgi:hypothetical protein
LEALHGRNNLQAAAAAAAGDFKLSALHLHGLLLQHLLLFKGSRAKQHLEALHGGNHLQAAAAAAVAAAQYQDHSSAIQCSIGGT